MADNNKVKLGLKSCYYAKATVTGGVISYDTPVALPGAVSLSMEAQGGDQENFYADDIIYFVGAGTNGGYQGDLTLAYIPDDFRKDILGDTVDQNGLLVEIANQASEKFALLFEFTGDKNQTRHVLYNCTAARPAVASQTKEEVAAPITEVLTITAIPTPTDGYVKAKADSEATNWASWFTAVQAPSL